MAQNNQICNPDDPEMNINVIEIVREWNNVALENRVNQDPSASIFNFMTYWMAFNLLYCEKHFGYNGNNNNDRIYNFDTNLSNNVLIKNDFKSQKLLSEHLRKRYGNDLIDCYISKNSKFIDPLKSSERTLIILYIDTIIDSITKPNVFNSIKSCCNELLKNPVSNGIKTYSKKQLETEHENSLSKYKQLCDNSRSDEKRRFDGKLKSYEKDINSFERSILSYDIITDNQEQDKRQIIAILMSIYQIRCNLFHGGKRPTPDIGRDCQLVSEAAQIMKIIIEIALDMKG